MKKGIATLDIRELKIPFKLSFKHHSAERSTTQSLIVIAGDGIYKGYGESCPREYVTNESIISVLSFFEEIKPDLLAQVNDFEDLKVFLKRQEIKISINPSAWCALELAVLDLFSKQKQCSLENLLSIPELTGTFQYTAVIGDGSFDSFSKMAGQYVKMKFNDFKIKISGDPVLDYKKFVFLNELTEGRSRIRLDANNLWNNIEDVVSYLQNCPVTVFAIEEPLVEKSISHLKELSLKIKTPLILDESFNNLNQFEQLKEHQQAFIINLRVSKMGGLLRSLELARVAKEQNIGLIIGAQVGETSILTRAGLCVANAIKPYQTAMEGGFGTQLLEHDLTATSLMFGLAGELRPEELLDKKENGFQLKVREESIGE
jgi:L-Ala-D/L-Glu epimerase